MKIIREWKKEKPIPDEGFLKARFEAETKAIEDSAVEEAENSRRRWANIEPLLKVCGVSKEDVDKWNGQAKSSSKASLKRVESRLLQPPFDIEARDSQDRKLVNDLSKKMSPKGNPFWRGLITAPAGGGVYWSFNGEAEERPAGSYDITKERVVGRAQAWGEGWWDYDYSELHAFLAFLLVPPSWGRLYVYVNPRLHGYYHMYSDDQWWNTAQCYAGVKIWAELHQHFWRDRRSVSVFHGGGWECHPTRYDRIDGSYQLGFFENVGERDLVMIHTGVTLRSSAQAAGSHSILDFQSGESNYVEIPWVYWELVQ